MESIESPRPTDSTVLAGLQAAIRDFRDRVTRAAALIADLRRRKEDLEQSVASMEAKTVALETTIRDLRVELTEKQTIIDELERHLAMRTDGSATGLGIDVGDKLLYLSPDEREALERQIGDLLNRIDAHLG